MCDQQNINSEGKSQDAVNSTENMTHTNFPSTNEIVCPKCNKNDLKILGTKGSKGAAVGVGMAFGAVGNLVASSMSKNDFTLQPIKYKCNSCGNKFESLPFNAKQEEILDEPCTVNFTRLSSFAGMAVAQNVWLNGVKVGSVGNGKSITFQTFLRYNTVFVTDQYGVAFKGDYKFEAQSGGTEDIRFKRKFK